MSKHKKRLANAPGEVREAIYAHVRKYADTQLPITMLSYLQEQFPDWDITSSTVTRAARTEGVTLLREDTGKGAETRQAITVDERVQYERKIQLLTDTSRSLNQRYQATLRGENLAQRILSDVSGMVATLPSPPQIKQFDIEDHRSEQEVMALLSCLHFGEFVDPEATMGLGNYDPMLAAARMQYFVDSILDLTFNHHRAEKIRKLHIVPIGDMVSGDIHDELKITNVFPLGEQIVRTAYLLAMAIRDCAAYFEEVEIDAVVGNHGRFERKPPFKDKYNNADYVVYNMAAALLADLPNVKWNIPKAWFITKNIAGHEFFFSHGDNVRSAFSFPWYDLSKFTAQMAQLFTAQGEPTPEYWGFGHFHQFGNQVLGYGEWLFTGTFKGPDEYSVGRLRAGTAAVQLFAGVHPKRGVSFRYPVVLEDADPDKQDRYLQVADKSWTPGS